MKWIQVSLSFRPDQVLMSRLAKRGTSGVWRVVHCSEVGNPLITRVDDFTGFKEAPFAGIKVLRMMSARPYRKGVMVDPLKIALAFNDAAAEERARIESILCVGEAGRMLNDSLIYFGKAAQAHG